MAFPTEQSPAREGCEGLEVVPYDAPQLDFRHQAEKEITYANEKERIFISQSSRLICGKPRPIAFVLFAILASIMVGAVVGGAVLTQVPSSPKSSLESAFTTSTTTPMQSSSSTASAAPSTATPTSTNIGTRRCPQSNNTDYTTDSGTGNLTFRQLCDVDWPAGIRAASGSVTSVVEDLSVVLEYSLIECIVQCAVHSLNNRRACMAVAYGANITLAQNRGVGGNCFLKSARGANPVADNSGQVESAFLIESV